MIQLYWRAHANNIIEIEKWERKPGERNDKAWFINPKLDESIKKAVGKALADCFTNMNAFKDKKAGEIIKLTFKDKTPKTYEQKKLECVDAVEFC